MTVAAVRAAGATKTTMVTAIGGGTSNNQLKAIRGSKKMAVAAAVVTPAPEEGCAAKMPATEATQQATTSQRNKRTRGRHTNDDAVQRHVCSKVVTQRHVENPLALLEQGFVVVFLGSP
jgi:hypothetical protein